MVGKSRVIRTDLNDNWHGFFKIVFSERVMKIMYDGTKLDLKINDNFDNCVVQKKKIIW